MKKSLQDFCVEENKTDLLEQWMSEKNGELTPANVSYGSQQKVWWRCEKRHVWQAKIYSRVTAASGCPYCNKKLPFAGETDLASTHPLLVEEWHTEKNGERSPTQFLAGSHQKVWWKCEKGHEWQAQIRSRANGDQCPFCTRQVVLPNETDLATTHPTLAAEWNHKKNGALLPTQVFAGSKKKVWWKCKKGHEWKAAIYSRLNGAGCPVCAGKVVIPGENDFSSMYPEIAAQWHPEKNDTLRPETVTPSSNKRVWWICERGHEWQMQINHRTFAGSGCPYCSGKRVLKGFNDLASVEPLIAAQWHPELNGSLTPEMVTAGSHKRVWWICPYDHVWKAVVYSRTCDRKHGCPECAGVTKRRPRYNDITLTKENDQL